MDQKVFNTVCTAITNMTRMNEHLTREDFIDMFRPIQSETIEEAWRQVGPKSKTMTVDAPKVKAVIELLEAVAQEDELNELLDDGVDFYGVLERHSCMSERFEDRLCITDIEAVETLCYRLNLVTKLNKFK